MKIKPNMSAEEVQAIKDNTLNKMGLLPKMSLSETKGAKPTKNGLVVDEEQRILRERLEQYQEDLDCVDQFFK